MISKTHFYLILILFTVFGCSTNENKPQPKESTANPAEMELGKRFTGIAEPCAKSKNYKQAEWINKNDCSWALEKELLSDLPEYGKRNDKELLLQIDNGDWQSFPTMDPKNSTTPYYHQWKAYHASAHYFLVEQIKPSGCNSYIWVDGKTGKQTKMSGSLWSSTDSKWLAILSNGTQECESKSEILKFSKAGELLQYPLNLGSGIKEVGWSKTHIFGKKDTNSTSHTFQKLPGMK